MAEEETYPAPWAGEKSVHWWVEDISSSVDWTASNKVFAATIKKGIWHKHQQARWAVCCATSGERSGATWGTGCYQLIWTPRQVRLSIGLAGCRFFLPDVLYLCLAVSSNLTGSQSFFLYFSILYVLAVRCAGHVFLFLTAQQQQQRHLFLLPSRGYRTACLSSRITMSHESFCEHVL